jgi:hypothetical protein
VRGWLAGALLSIVLLPGLNAQAIHLRPGSLGIAGCSFDTTVVRETTVYTLFLAARQRGDSAQLAPVLQRILDSFVPPAKVSYPLWPGTYFPVDSADRLGTPRMRGVGPFTGELRIDFADGKVKTARWDAPPDSPELQAAVLEAVQRSAGLPGSVPGGRGRRSSRVTLGTATSPHLASGVPILKLRVPTIRVEQPVSVIQIPTPALPGNFQEHRSGSFVDLRYVVAEDGRVPPKSIKVLQAEDSSFAISARRAILAGLFQPAQTQGCPVQMLVQQRITYRF